MMAFAFKEKERCFYRWLLHVFPPLQCIFPWPAPQEDQKASACEGDAPQPSAGYGAAWVPDTS